jgi:hypothetical protein
MAEWPFPESELLSLGIADNINYNTDDTEALRHAQSLLDVWSSLAGETEGVEMR